MTLDELIHQYLEARSSRSASQLAQKCKVGGSTVRRILQKEGDVTFQTAICILREVTNRETMVEVLQSMFPDMLPEIKEHLAIGAEASTDQSDLLDEYVVQEPHCFIIHLCGTRKGASAKEIAERYGKSGVRALNKMVDVGLLKLEAGKYHLISKKDFYITDPNAAKKLTVIMSSRFNVENLGTPVALLGQSSEALNDAGISEVKRILANATHEIERVKEDPKYAGDRVYFASVMLNLLEGEDTFEEEGRTRK